jgi:hypothetical protein
MKKKRKPYHCKHCKKAGHNRVTCPGLASQRKCARCKGTGHTKAACPLRKPCPVCHEPGHGSGKHTGEFTATLIAGKRAIIEPMAQPGTKLVHIAYEPKTMTLEVAYTGEFTLLRFRYAKVQPTVFNQLRAARRPADFIDHVVKPTTRGHFVTQRSMSFTR